MRLCLALLVQLVVLYLPTSPTAGGVAGADKVVHAAVFAAVAACGSKPVQPSWKVNAADALKGYSDAYLKGNTPIAETEFARARSEIASTGRPTDAGSSRLWPPIGTRLPATKATSAAA